MECFIVVPLDVDTASGRLLLRDDEARHAARSLRMRVGEALLATDLEGTCYRCTIERMEEHGRQELFVHGVIDAVLPEFNESALDVELIQGILNQPSKFEEIVERCTEIGIKTFTPVMSERVERNNLKTDRLEKILRMGCKQSYRARKPILGEPASLEVALTAAREAGRTLILLHESAPADDTLSAVLACRKSDRISLVVGPEGGFTDAEVDAAASEHSAAIASLGARRLRAETAAIAASAITLSHENR